MSGPSSIALRIWRDGAVRSLPLWLAVTLFSTNVLALVSVFPTARQGLPAVPAYQLLLTLWLPTAVYLLLGKVRARCHRIDLALPISARELWLAHSLAMAVAAAVVLAMGFGVLTVVRLLLARFDAGPVPALRLLPLAAPLGAAAALATLLVQRLQPGAWKPAGEPRHWAVLAGGLVLISTALLLLSPWPLVATALFLLLTAVLGGSAWAALPSALELAPLVDNATAKPRAAAEGDRDGALTSAAPVGAVSVLRLVFRVLHNAPPWKTLMPWLLYSFILLVGFLLAGGFSVWTDLDESRILNLPLGAYLLFTGAGLLTYHLHRLDPLPIPRRTLFHALALPSLLAFCVGWGAGHLVLTASASSRQLVSYRIVGDQQWVQVDPGFMGFSAGGEAPMLTAPWGESHRAWHRPLFRGSRLLLYSPFNTPEPSSARFEALMTSRAIHRVYGERVPPAEIQRRYFEVENDEIVGLRGAGLTLLADYPALPPPPLAAGTPLYMVLTLVPWLLLLAAFVRSFRAAASVRVIRGIYWGGLGLLLAALTGQFVAAVTGLYSPAAAYGLLAILSRRIDSSPPISLTVWTVSLGLIWLAYRLAQGQFRRAELPASPLQFALVDWCKSD